MENPTKISIYLSEILNIPKDYVTGCTAYYKVQKVAKNTVLLQPGEISKHTYFVEKGLLRMYSLDRNGKEHIIQFAPENWLIADRSSIYFNQKSNFYIESIEDSEVYLLENNFFTAISEDFPHVAGNNDILLQKHIRNLQNRVNSLLSDTAEERYLNFIKMYPDILLRVPQLMVASYLGITPESLSRVRKELARKNFKTT